MNLLVDIEESSDIIPQMIVCENNPLSLMKIEMEELLSPSLIKINIRNKCIKRGDHCYSHLIECLAEKTEIKNQFLDIVYIGEFATKFGFLKMENSSISRTMDAKRKSIRR